MESGLMLTECVKEAATVPEAVDAALEELGVQQDAVEYEVLSEAAHKIFGMGSEREARVRVWIKPEYLSSLEADRESGADEVEEQLPVELRAAPGADLTDEELDGVADTAVESLQKILHSFDVEDSSIEEYEGDEGEIILDVVGGDLALLIGRHGRTLDALQTLVSAITTRKIGFRYPIIVDIEGYRHRRRQKIEDIARRAADRASRQHSPVRLRPMTAYERRVVHVALRDDRRVATASEGDEPFRMVVISPK
jgi:spoIIIJ-associated protein